MAELNEQDIQLIKKQINDSWFDKFGKDDLNDMDDDEIIDQAIQMLRYCDNALFENIKNERSEAELLINELYFTMKLTILEDIKKLPEDICNKILNLYHKAIGIDGIINFVKSCKVYNKL